jgi:YD repeat-containing protein
MKASSIACCLWLLGLVFAVGCSGKSTNPTAPSTSTSSCRTYASAATSTVTAGPVVGTDVMTCSFSTSTNQLTCTSQYSDNIATSIASTYVLTYGSTSDFVAEVKVVPPLRRWTRLTSSPTRASPNDTMLVSTYDSENRLIREVETSGSETDQTTTYTSWDGSGRPTAGTLVSSAGTMSIVSVYSDSSRTETKTMTLNGQPFTTVSAYDVNGNPTTLSSSVATTQTTTTATETVCR